MLFTTFSEDEFLEDEEDEEGTDDGDEHDTDGMDFADVQGKSLSHNSMYGRGNVQDDITEAQTALVCYHCALQIIYWGLFFFSILTKSFQQFVQLH